jgi:SAM-dependent methyltransferase
MSAIPSTTGAAAPAAPPPSTVPDLSAIKARQHAAWSSGDYGVVGTTLQIVGESLCEAADVRAGERVLDVAAGNGNASLAAARRFATVLSTDYVESLLAQGSARAEAERLPVEFRQADAECLQLPDASFDVVLSSFGVMFTADSSRAAAELLRVCRPGGRIGLASWTPDGFVGRMFRILGRYVPPAPGVRPPSFWGTEDGLAELFGEGASSIRSERRAFVFRYRSAEHWLSVFRSFYGPMLKTFAAVGKDRQASLERDILALLEEHNRDGSTLVVPSDYLESVIVRR